jgi:hypothetical protein
LLEGYKHLICGRSTADGNCFVKEKKFTHRPFPRRINQIYSKFNCGEIITKKVIRNYYFFFNWFYRFVLFIYLISYHFSVKKSDKKPINNDDPSKEWQKKSKNFTKTEQLLLQRFKSIIDYCKKIMVLNQNKSLKKFVKCLQQKLV